MNYLELKKQDTILLEDEQIQYAIDAFNNFVGQEVNIFLNKGVIKQRETGQLVTYLYFDMVVAGLYNLEYYVINNAELVHVFTINLNVFKKNKHTKIKYLNKIFDSEKDILINGNIRIFIGTFYFINQMLSEQETVTKEIKSKTNKKGNKQNDLETNKPKENNKKVINITNKKYEYINLNLSESSYKHLKEYRKRTYSGSWSVKGHLRHYKNGKIGYVKPYIKGTGDFKGKEYKIELK